MPSSILFGMATAWETLIESGFGRDFSVEYTRDMTLAHENSDSNPNGISFSNEFASAMDLNNNLIGRSYVRSRTTWGIFNMLRSMPSKEEIRNALRDKANNNIRLAQSVRTDIISWTNTGYWGWNLKPVGF